MTYLQVDTVTVFTPVYSQTVSTQERVIVMHGSGDDWIISDSTQPMVNLKLTSSYVLLNGCWVKRSGIDSLFYFADPSIAMQRSFESAHSWSGYTPMYHSAPSDSRLAFANYYFGFATTRTYIGTEKVIVPAGSYTTYRFDVDLYLQASDSTEVGTATEYYVPNVGPVRLTLRGQGLVRSLSLISYQ